MIPPLLAAVPEAQVVLVGATPAKLRSLDRLGVLDRVHLLPPTSDEGTLARFYAAADVFVTAAEIGESHSFAIEEAMCLGVPVVTCSTPWVDNAQIEQVDNGATGYLAGHPDAFAEAVAAILRDDGLRERLSANSRAKSDRLYAAAPLTRQLQRLYEFLLGERTELGDWLVPAAELDDFGSEYEQRLTAGFRALTEREAAEVAAGRRLERLRWLTRGARDSLNPEGLRYAAGVVRARIPGARA